MPYAIGVFDSGVGGLSVWREIVRQFPNEWTLYIADQAHVPYGSRRLAEVRELSEGTTRFLLAQGARVIVIACNTASAAALHYLRCTFPQVPFVGMEPAVKPAVERTCTGVVGVIATQATFQGELFASLLERYSGDIRVIHRTGIGRGSRDGSVRHPEDQEAVTAVLAAFDRGWSGPSGARLHPLPFPPVDH